MSFLFIELETEAFPSKKNRPRTEVSLASHIVPNNKIQISRSEESLLIEVLFDHLSARDMISTSMKDSRKNAIPFGTSGTSKKKGNGLLTFRMHPFCTFLPDIFSHLCHTMISCNWGRISISFDVSNSSSGTTSECQKRA